FVIGAGKVWEFLQQVFDDFRLHRLIDSRSNRDIAGVKTYLPFIRRRDHHVAPDEFTPVHVIAKSGGEQPDTISAFAKDLVGLLEYRHAGPFEVSRVGGDVLLFGYDFQPVVEPPDHDGADRTHGRDVLLFLFAALESTFHRFGHGNALRQGERNRGIYADAPVGSFFDRGQTCLGD